MGWNKCLENDPDCLNCPYEDCIATTHDISRQEAHKRNGFYEKQGREIARLIGYGATRKYVSAKYGVQSSRISLYLRRYQDEYQAAQAETQSKQYKRWEWEDIKA